MRLMSWCALVLMGSACGRSVPDPPPTRPAQLIPAALAYVTEPTPDVIVGAADVSDGLPVVTTCPTLLTGSERAHRVVGKACGVVTVRGSYVIEEGSLSLEAGATLAFVDDGELVVGSSGPAKLLAHGTAADPVTFTAAGDQLDGVWRGIKLRARASRSELEHVHIDWAGQPDDAALVIDGDDVVLDDVHVRGSRGMGVWLGKETLAGRLAGLSFERVAKAVVMLAPRAAGALVDMRFGDGQHVEVSGGTIAGHVVWPAIGVPYVLAEVVRVESDGNQRALLELAAGSEVHFGPLGFIEVGFTGAGRLETHGSAAQPVVIRATSADPERASRHKGLRIYTKGEAELDGLDIADGGEDGAIYVQRGRLAMRGGAVRQSLVGVHLQKDATLTTLDGVVFSGCPVALDIAARHLGFVQPSNTFDDAALIAVSGSVVDGDVTWQPLGAPIVVSGDIALEGRATLTLAPGLSLRMREAGRFLVGFEAPATLTAIGTAEAPITLGDTRDEAESWGGMTFYSNTRDSHLAHVRLVSVDAELAAIDARESSEVSFADVSCSRCSAPTLTWRCESKITQANVTARDGTPAATRAPEHCD